MHLALALLFGFLFGFIGSMPVAGPIAALVFARALQGRYRAGFAIAAGAAVAEAGYAALTFWGLSNLLSRDPAVLPVSRGLAAVALTALGVVLLRQRRLEPATAPPEERLRGSVLLGFTVTALNPTFLATWTAASATLASTGWLTLTPRLSVPFAAAACAGIVAWFAVLLALVRRYHQRFRPETLIRALRVIGWALLGLAAWFLYGLVIWLW